MAYSKIALLLIFNVICFTLVSSTSLPLGKLTCKDSVKFKVCANVLNLAKVSLPAKAKCCTLIKGLVDLDAAVCLCTAIKADLLGIKLNIPVSLSVIFNACGKMVPSHYKCA
ncbi:hypothetical protein N665_0109s0081 [Sinapis alba]|nr:hypothetical protein N665_0109s0080 [Sinapis alba]KAF8108461.1 hypothetical protein N665_0109s0081 [Sinapis alba]